MPDPTCEDLCNQKAAAVTNKANAEALALAYGALATSYSALQSSWSTTAMNYGTQITTIQMQIDMFPGGCTC